MKILVVFYSLTGNTQKIAGAISRAACGEIMELKTKKEIPGQGFNKYFNAGLQLIRGGRPELLPPEKNANDYDFIFLGTPVWAGNFAPPVRSFLEGAKLRGKRIALFCAHGGDDPGKSFENLEKELAGNQIVGKIDFKMDMIPTGQLEKNLEKVAEWARGIAGK